MKKINKIFVFIQFLLTITCLVLGFMYLLGNKGLLSPLEIVVGIDLILMGVSSYIVHKSVKYMIVYLVVGIIMISCVILKMVGVI